MDKPIAKDKARKKKGFKEFANCAQLKRAMKSRYQWLSGMASVLLSMKMREIKKGEEEGAGGTEGGYL